MTAARTRLALAVLTLPALLVALDLSVLLVALPRLAEDLHADAARQLWITDVYGFLVAGFLVTMGTLGDRIGRRRLLLIGAATFGAASLAAASAPTPELLIAARAALGIAGATLMPSTLALVTSLYTDPRRQGVAIATVFSAIMVGGALGPALGGLLLQHFWWGAVFLPGVAVMVLLLAVGPRLLPEGAGTGVGRLDPASVALSLLALLPVVHGVKALARGDAGVPTVAALVVGVAAGVAFVRRQRRLEHPLLDLRLLAHPALRGALATMLLGGVVMGGMFLVITQDLQLVAGLDPLAAGLATLPGTVAMLVGVIAGPYLARRVRPAWVMAGGTTLAALGLAGVALAAPGGTAPMITAFTVALFGMGLPGGLGVGLVVGSAPPAQAGSASSLSETGQELGMAVGLAGMGSLAVAVYRALLPDEVSAAAREGLAGAVTTGDPGVVAPAREAFTGAVTVTAAVAAVVLLVVSALVVATLGHVPATPAGAPAPEPVAA
ncbi:MFS transporter [Actinomycetospora lutea]|uniref:MFS transporter n=1 Tax=Actinomycetospora lutea TaxID=663604 RepID=UPI002365A959|nr:MFS transporter [Actinomycetospora lutea]MDD7937342.1 MFS transporter [Actinomycetospora lutea]